MNYVYLSKVEQSDHSELIKLKAVMVVVKQRGGGDRASDLNLEWTLNE